MTEANELEHNRRLVEEMRERIDHLESGLEHIAKEGDCSAYHDEDEEDSERPERHCTCDQCIAKRALRHRPTGYDWRYRGVLHGRVHCNPREARMLRAWADKVGDNELGNVLFPTGGMYGPGSWPTARDWYVATTVVQWLATNIGMGVLEASGFHYTKWKEDHAIETACDVSGELGRPNKPKHPERIG